MELCGDPHPAYPNLTCDLPLGHERSHHVFRPNGFDCWIADADCEQGD